MAQPKLVYTKEPNVEITTLATAAVLLEVNISTWTGRKRDKKTSAEVNATKGTHTDRAASVIKNLMSDDADLDNIRAYAQDTRLWTARHTLEWAGSQRILPSMLIFDITSELDSRIVQFDALVAKFVAGYTTKVSAAAFKLGQLFDRNEFPTAEEVGQKFKMRYTMSPVPTSGDFRVDVQNNVGEFLKAQYAKAADERVAALMREPWERTYDVLAHIKERMDAALAFEPELADSKRNRPKMFQSMLDNAHDLVNLLDKLNVTGDLQLTECAAKMRRMLAPLDIKTIRESRESQESVKKQVEDILEQFDFGGFGNDD